MEYVYLALVLMAAFVPAALAVIYTNQTKKRGCGRGCGRCGNRDSCHRSRLSFDDTVRPGNNSKNKPY